MSTTAQWLLITLLIVVFAAVSFARDLDASRWGALAAHGTVLLAAAVVATGGGAAIWLRTRKWWPTRRAVATSHWSLTFACYGVVAIPWVASVYAIPDWTHDGLHAARDHEWLDAYEAGGVVLGLSVAVFLTVWKFRDFREGPEELSAADLAPLFIDSAVQKALRGDTNGTDLLEPPLSLLEELAAIDAADILDDYLTLRDGKSAVAGFLAAGANLGGRSYQRWLDNRVARARRADVVRQILARHGVDTMSDRRRVCRAARSLFPGDPPAGTTT